ncbi:MAG: Asp-tRNA(Asn)/Glu-tRNA(Gln) amidotransferase subunit GatC [Calditrichaeota bacterium]|nr:MAG: Asp-tRNA(Asn)/Glu-tRNA(Gln) amidotransferase subunit GatC [Calditrichota bacterium]
MAVSVEQVEYIARLAKLRFTEEEKKRLAQELNAILQYVEKLNELDTTGVEPLSHTAEVTNRMREDVVEASLPVEEALRNAPDRAGNFFRVPKVVK